MPGRRFDGIVGSGHCYSFVHTGMYTYDPGGPARTRTLLSDRLPLHSYRIDDAECGSRAGDPVYLVRSPPSEGYVAHGCGTRDEMWNWQEVRFAVLAGV